MQRSSEAILLSAFTTGEARTASFEISLKTKATSELIDITEHVRALVGETDIESGIALVSSPHTTCAVIVNEAEDGFSRDFQRALEALAPADAHYDHNAAPHAEEWEAPNGHAHVRAAFLSSPSVTLPIRDGGLVLGRWQRVFFVELDRARPRTCQITLLGRAT
jgi:secondary thiamine-phosphate synthase enzyme